MKLIILTLFLVTHVVFTTRAKSKYGLKRSKAAKIKEAMQYFLNIKGLDNRSLSDNFPSISDESDSYNNMGPEVRELLLQSLSSPYKSRPYRSLKRVRKMKTHELKEEMSLLKHEFHRLQAQTKDQPLQSKARMPFGDLNQSMTPSRQTVGYYDNSNKNAQLASNIANLKAQLNVLETEMSRRLNPDQPNYNNDPLINLGHRTADYLGINTKWDALAAGAGATALAYGGIKHDKLKKKRTLEIKHLTTKIADKEAIGKVLDQEQTKISQVCDELGKVSNRTKLVERNIVFRLQQRVDNMFY